MDSNQRTGLAFLFVGVSVAVSMMIVPRSTGAYDGFEFGLLTAGKIIVILSVFCMGAGVLSGRISTNTEISKKTLGVIAVTTLVAVAIGVVVTVA